MNLLDFVRFMSSPASHLLFIGVLLLYLLWLKWTNFHKYSIVVYRLSFNMHIVIIAISLLVFVIQLVCTAIDWFARDLVVIASIVLETQGLHSHDGIESNKVEIAARDTTQTPDQGNGFAASSPLDKPTPPKKDPIKVEDLRQSSSIFQWGRNKLSDYIEGRVINDTPNPIYKDTLGKVSRTLIGGNIEGQLGPFPPEALGIKDPNDNNQDVQVLHFIKETKANDGKRLLITCTNSEAAVNAATVIPESVGNPPIFGPYRTFLIEKGLSVSSPYHSNCYVKIMDFIAQPQSPVVEPDSPRTPTEKNPHYLF